MVDDAFEVSQLQLIETISFPVLMELVCPTKECGEKTTKQNTYTNAAGTVTSHLCSNMHLVMVKGEGYPKIDFRLMTPDAMAALLPEKEGT